MEYVQFAEKHVQTEDYQVTEIHTPLIIGRNRPKRFLMERLYRREDLTVTIVRLILVALVSLGVVFGIKV